MTPSSSSCLSKFPLLLACVGFSLVNCHGTEGDNPFTGTVNPSACKGEDEYVNFRHQGSEGLASNEHLFESADYQSLAQALVAAPNMPIGLRCFEWHFSGDKLLLTVSNFTGGCHVGWEGDIVLRQAGELTIELANPSCDVARCGSCFYDVDAEFEAPLNELMGPEKDLLDVELALRDCEGEETGAYQWQIPAYDQEQGLSCEGLDTAWAEAYRKASASGSFTETHLNLYAQCETGSPDDVACTEDRSCVEGHCVPSCTSDDECPLRGALTCQNGACQLAK